MSKYKNIPGPWDSEPDYESGITKTGLPYYMCRNRVHAWCGYVGHTKRGYVLTEEPYYTFGLCELSESLCIHGGVTWNHDHKPNYSPDGLIWYGFDCSHCGDMIPDYLEKEGFGDYVYRDIDYVRDDCEKMAQQIVDAEVLAEEEIRRLITEGFRTSEKS